MEAAQTALLEPEARQSRKGSPGGAARFINHIRRKTRKRVSAEDKIRIVLEGFRKELPVADLCRREGINASVYYSWLKDFMEAGKCRLKGDSIRSATAGEVKRLKAENQRLKSLAGEQALDISLLKKSLNA